MMKIWLVLHSVHAGLWILQSEQTLNKTKMQENKKTYAAVLRLNCYGLFQIRLV